MLLSTAFAVLSALGQGSPAAPRVEGQEFVYEAAPFPSCHASTLLEVRGGEILAAWFGGTGEGHPDVGIWVSRRKAGGAGGAAAWGAPWKAAAEAGAPCWNPVLCRGPDGNVWLFYKVGPSPERWTGAYLVSPDEGETFGPPVRLPAGLLGPIKNKPLTLPSGALLCGSSVESYQAWACWVERLAKDGKSWSRHGPIAAPGHPHGIIQPALYPGDAPGEVFMLVRSRGIGRVLKAGSTDEGRTWGPAEPTELPNPNSGIDAVRLRDGRLLAVYNHTPLERSPLNLAVSRDLGRSWAPAALLEDAPGEYSYPAVIQLSGGDVAVTYTWKRLRIRFARIPLSLFEKR